MTKTLDLDERDTQILRERRAALVAIGGPREGDWVRFADGTERRISYIWRDEHGVPFNVQTSRGGSFYLGDGHVSFSGSLFDGIKPETLTQTYEHRDGAVWFFHHDQRQAHNGVDAVIPFRVYECSLPATS